MSALGWEPWWYSSNATEPPCDDRVVRERESDARVVGLTEARGEERREAGDDVEGSAALADGGRDRGAPIGRERERLRSERQRAGAIDGERARRRIGEDGAREPVRTGLREAVDAEAERVEQLALGEPDVGRERRRCRPSDTNVFTLCASVGVIASVAPRMKRTDAVEASGAKRSPCSVVVRAPIDSR